MSGSICKYCQKVELVFDNAYKSKTGKLIPLDKTSGLPHQCSENPYTKQQQQQQQQQTSSSSSYQVSDESVDRGISAFSMMSDLIRLVEQTQKLLVTMDGKLDRLLNLAERK